MLNSETNIMKNKTKTIGIRITDEEYQMLLKEALLLSKQEKKIMTISHVIRKMLKTNEK